MSKTAELEKLIEPVAQAEGMELVDLQYVAEQGKKVLRIFLDKQGGMKLSDCEKVSGLLGDLLDKSDLLPESYVLEVSSPGIDRILKKEKDFVRFKGSRVRITLFAPIEGQRNFLGPIVDAGNGAVTVADVSGKQVTVPLEKIARARLDPEL